MSTTWNEQHRSEEQLCFAARDGNLDEVRRLVEREGVDPNKADALRYACVSDNNLVLVQYLVEEARVDVNKELPFGGKVLHEVCTYDYENQLSLVQFLCQSGGANVNVQNSNGSTPLHCASHEGFIDVVRYLVEQQEADVNVKNGDNLTPLDLAFMFPHLEISDVEEVIRFLLPRVSSVSKRSMQRFFETDLFVDFMDNADTVLSKYAWGRGLEIAFSQNPIHTLLLEFALLSEKAFQRCIKVFPASTLSIPDSDGRHPIHIVLSSTEQVVRSASIVLLIFERESRSALMIDPMTGLYPHEAAAGLISSEEEGSCCWLDATYKMFRSNPQRLLREHISAER